MSTLEIHTVGAPDVVQNLHGSSCEIRLTKGDGACAIHSVFGDDVSGEFVKVNARAFLPAISTRMDQQLLEGHLVFKASMSRMTKCPLKFYEALEAIDLDLLSFLDVS